MMHGGKAMVKIFQRAGVDYIFSSPGTEWPPVWEAFAEFREQGIDRPQYINCRHEAAAVAMASGYTKITGKPQAVLLHATAGPLNAAMFLRAAYQERVPMVICCGETSAFGEESRLPDPGNQWIHGSYGHRRPGGVAPPLRQVVRPGHFADDPCPEPRAGDANCRGTTGRTGTAWRAFRVHAG